LADIKHFPPISEEELKRLYGSEHTQPNTPVRLQNKVQLDVRIYFARGGLENMSEMTKDIFCVSGLSSYFILFFAVGTLRFYANVGEWFSEYIADTSLKTFQYLMV
jgi:hypothetical protein